MKFVKKNDWEKEWKETLKKEEDYLRKKAKKKDSFLNQTLEERIPESLQKTLEGAFCSAFSLIFEKGTDAIRRTYDKEKKRADLFARQEAVKERGDRASLQAFSKGTALSSGKNLALSGIEGIGLGLVGVGIPDIPLFSAMILKSLYEIADHYGFPYKSENEQLFLLRLIDASLSHGEELEKKNTAIDRYIGLQKWDDFVPVSLQIRRTSAQLSGELLYMKFLQGIPIAGAVGGAYDVIYLNMIQTYARMKYHKRFLLRQKNSKEFYQ